MTTVINPTSSTFQELIQTCRRSHQQFKRAAEKICDADLKRLLTIYSLQRTRFAEELKAHLGEWLEARLEESNEEDLARSGEDEREDVLRWCLEKDADSLRAYANALSAVSPSKTQFLISAQYSLMRQAHERMASLASRQPACTLKTDQLAAL
jgi:hypothetical protein